MTGKDLLSPMETNASRDGRTMDSHQSHDVQRGQVMVEKFSLWSMLALAFSILGTWSTLAQSLSAGLVNGGPVTILWGLALVTFCNICVAVSLGELCSAMPTALGQAYYIHRLWNTPTGRFASYMCAWINVFGWWTLTASQVAFMAEFLLSLKLMFDPDWTGASKSWVVFLVYLGVTGLFTGVNWIACRKDAVLPWFNNIVGISFTGLFIIFSLALVIAVGVKDDLTYQPASFAFGTWINRSGWNDGVVWFIGLIQAAYGLTAFDSVIHMVEELPQPRRNAPRAIWLAVSLGAISGFIFMLVCVFCVQDIEEIIQADLPFIAIVQDAIGLQGAATLIALFTVSGLGQGVSIATSGSRLTWGFSRDGGLPWYNYFAKVDEYWKVPARALALQGGIIALVGVLYLFATTVLDAILGVATIALTISYGMPILVLLLVGRDKLPQAEFRLGRFGAVINWISVVYCAVTTVFFFFPGSPNPSIADMNWAIAVFGVMLVVALGFWVIKGQARFLRTGDAEERMAHALEMENSTGHLIDPDRKS